MDIKIINHPGGIIQQTDKPIINVFGDVNVDKGEKSQTVTDSDADYAEYTEVESEPEHEDNIVNMPKPKTGSDEKKVNYFSPQKNLQELLQQDWFETVCVDKKLYSKDWRVGLVTDLMASEHGVYIARLWEHQDKIPTIKGKFIGTLILAGVLKDNKLAVSRAILGIDKNTRDKDEKKEASTFANYMGQCRSEPYVDWIKDYVTKLKEKA